MNDTNPLSSLSIEPPHWFSGMKDTQLQLMLSAEGIAHAVPSLYYPNARITDVVRLDSPNYIFIYIDLNGAEPGVMPLSLNINGESYEFTYELRPRDMRGEERIGFSKADVLYMLMPDRFAQGKDLPFPISTKHKYSINRRMPSLRHGGDLEGIRQHLDYLADLGVTALWLTPVLENDSPDHKGFSTYHGYATTDYYRVDPRLGTNEEYRSLIDEAHGKGLKVVMDMIFNHCGKEHPWIADPPSGDWFHDSKVLTSYKLTPVVDPYASEIDHRETVDGWFVPTMPDFNQQNPHLMRYLTQNSIWWIETMGIDGIRMDTYPYADAVAMSKWMDIINKEYPNFTVVGESWVTDPAFTAALQKDSRITPMPHGYTGDAPFNTNLTSVMDFAFFERINYAKGEETDEWFMGLNRIYNTFCYDYLYPAPHNVMAFLDNHDTDRFLGKGKSVKMLMQAMALLLTCNRIPQIYYGTEILMNGTKERTDGDVRKDFPGGFPSDRRNAFTAKGRTAKENEFFNWLRTLLHWRRNNEVIIHGKQKQYCPYNGIYVMTHTYHDRHVMVILNGTSRKALFSASRYAEDNPHHLMAKDIITGEPFDIAHDFTMSPRQTLILEYR